MQQTLPEDLSAADRLLVEACSSRGSAAVERILEQSPEVARANLLTAAVTGELRHLELELASNPEAARQAAGPLERPPILYLAYSSLLSPEGERSERMVECARRLLAAGADPNSYFTVDDDPNNRQTALYGASGIARSPELTQLLLEAGADPNDGAPEIGSESLYHASETDDLACLELLLAAGPKADNVSYCLGRKLDFEDPAGVALYLAYGADPNFVTPFGERKPRLHHAIRRDRSLEVVSLLLGGGADPQLLDARGKTAYALAVRLGRTHLTTALLEAGSQPGEASAVDRYLGAMMSADRAAADACIEHDPDLRDRLGPMDLATIALAAEEGRLEAVRLMLEHRFDVGAAGSDGMTAAHWAAWHGRTELLALLLANDTPLEQENRYGGAVLGMVVWAAGQSPDKIDFPTVVAMLLEAGADPTRADYPCGHPEVDALLAAARSSED